MHTPHKPATAALLALTAASALVLAACSDPGATTQSASDPNGAAASGGAATTDVTPFDVSQIPTVDEIAALVPDEVKTRGTLRNGASADYAPGEFRASDGQTVVGYDADLTRALAKVMGLKDGTTSHAEFPTIIPSIGTKFDPGISSFTSNPHREQQTNMIAYVQVGSAYGVAQGNPKGFDPAQPCGKTIGVQTGTAQEEYVNKLSEECVSAGNEAITVMPHDVQTSVATKVVGGQYDATLADSTVIGYTAASRSTSRTPR